MRWDGRLQANALHLPLADQSVHMVVCSPPYWGLRRYKIPDVILGGDRDCVHQWEHVTVRADERSRVLVGKSRTTNRFYGHPSRKFNGNHQKHTDGSICASCGAYLGQLGLEPSPAMYVEHLVEIFDEIGRVLRDDGTVWLNLGDSYTDSGRGSDIYRQGTRYNQAESRKVRVRETRETGLKEKNLVGVPWRAILALQEAGWYWRSTIAWHKKNAMPGSQTDRPTSSWEPVFLLSKAKRYYYDHVAIMEPVTGHSHPRGNGTGPKTVDESGQHANNRSFSTSVTDVVFARNKRDVWSINSEQLSENHYAAFPERLVEPCILAGTSEHGCCAHCHAPWRRQIEKQQPKGAAAEYTGKYVETDSGSASRRIIKNNGNARAAGADHDHFLPPRTIGWKKSCKCETNERVPAIVLDPFAGSGTTARVAERLNRRWLAIDLGYQDMQARRTSHVQKELLHV